MCGVLFGVSSEYLVEDDFIDLGGIEVGLLQ